MYYVGLDAHLRQSTICVLDDRGRKIRTWSIRGQWSEVLKELEGIRRPFAVCFGLRFSPRPFENDGLSGGGCQPRAVTTDLSFEAQERPGGCGEVGQVAVFGRSASGLRALDGSAVVASNDRPPSDSGAGASSERGAMFAAMPGVIEVGVGCTGAPGCGLRPGMLGRPDGISLLGPNTSRGAQ